MKVSIFFDGQNFYRSLQRYDEALRVDYDRLAAWITHCRRHSRDYEELPETSEALIYISMIRLMTRRTANRNEC